MLERFNSNYTFFSKGHLTMFSIIFIDYMNYQYFIQIVPTDIQTLIGSWPTFQYSVKEQAREVGNYAVGSSGIPGKLKDS